MTETVLHTLDDFTRGIAEQPRVMLFKHSPICPISAAALVEWKAFRKTVPAAATCFVDVVADRPAARGIADQCGVRHESPQAILFAAGKPVWHASHEGITLAALQKAWGNT